MTMRIDHVVLAVADLDGTAATWESAGFVVTPRADHPFGTSNRLVVFDSTYVELVAVTRPILVPGTGFAADVTERLAHSGSGITHLALHTSDARGEAELREADVFDFSRPAPLVGGGETQASFSLVVLDDRERPGLFFCQHHTPEAVWTPAHVAHPNGASRITSVELAGPRPVTLPVEDAIALTRFDAAADILETDGVYPPFTIGSLELRSRRAAS